MDARNAYDAERADTLLAPDVSLNDTPIIGLDELGPGFEMLRIHGFRYEPYECTKTVVATETDVAAVSCTYMMNTRLQEIGGYPPVEGSFDFTIEGGQINRLSQNFNFDEFGPAYDKFLNWLEGAHSGGFGELFRVTGSVSTPLLTPEALALLPGYLDEYEQDMNG